MKEKLIDYDTLCESHLKCKNGVSWKPHVKRFNVFATESIYRMHTQLETGKWHNTKPREILIQYPKKRVGYAIPFKDRIYQRCINDLVLYPKAQKRLIKGNCACQKGKGTTYAIDLLKQYMHSFYCRYGLDGYVCQIDIHKYYQSMPHKLVKDKYKELINDDDVYKMVCDILDSQVDTNVGYRPGSQMIQIAGIYVLNDLDHYIKERLHEKYYIRYSDDFIIIAHDYDTLKDHLKIIIDKLNDMGFTVNEKKTHIYKISKPFNFLGFVFKMSPSGKVIMTLKSANIKHERKKLARAVAKAKKGLITKSKCDEMFRSWKAFASLGNTYQLLKRMDKYYKELWEDDKNGT